MSARKDYCRVLIIAILLLAIVGGVGLGMLESARNRYASEWLARIYASAARAIETRRQAANGQPEVWLVGDSRAADWGLPQLPGWCVVNLGAGGMTSAELRRSVAPMLDSGTPRVVVIQAGINDLKILGVRPELKEEIVSQCVSNLVALVDRAERRGARVLVTTVWPTGPVSLTRRFVWGPEIEAGVLDCNRRLRAALQARPQVQLVDLFSDVTRGGAAGQSETLYRDTLHFTPAAYALFTAKLASLLKP